jgi:hypothetical protein
MNTPHLPLGSNPADWLLIAQRLQALAQTGLAYQPNQFDLERYQEIHDLSLQMMAHLTQEPIPKLEALFPVELGVYPTPKVDVRGVVFRGTDEILLVQEKLDFNRWSLPGGWADAIKQQPKQQPSKVAETKRRFIIKPTNS